MWRSFVASTSLFAFSATGFTEWYAHGLDDLREDPTNGIFSLDGEEIDRNRGPYR